MKFKQNFMIAKDKYETVFRACLDYTQSKTKSKIPFGLADMIQQQYYDDGKDSVEATCEPISEQPNTSLIRVNLARPISVEKCQQLTAHEGTHHIQNCLTRPAFTKYPELAFEFKYSPMDFVFEAAAEVAIQTLSPPTASSLGTRFFLFHPIVALITPAQVLRSQEQQREQMEGS